MHDAGTLQGEAPENQNPFVGLQLTPGASGAQTNVVINYCQACGNILHVTFANEMIDFAQFSVYAKDLLSTKYVTHIEKCMSRDVVI